MFAVKVKTQATPQIMAESAAAESISKGTLFNNIITKQALQDESH